MSWASNIDKAELGSKATGTPLIIGKNNYQIADVIFRVKEGDNSGKIFDYIVNFKRSGVIHPVWFKPNNDNETVAKIAADQLGELGKAAGLKGVMKHERIKQLIGKSVELDVYLNKKGYATISKGGINVVSSDEKEEEPELEEAESEEAEEEEKENPWD